MHQLHQTSLNASGGAGGAAPCVEPPEPEAEGAQDRHAPLGAFRLSLVHISTDHGIKLERGILF